MYQIMDRDVRFDVRHQLRRALNYRANSGQYLLGGSEDSAFMFAVAADQDSLANRLLDCAARRYANADRMISSAAKLWQIARGLELIEKATEARMRADSYLNDAIVFETAIDATNQPDWEQSPLAQGQNRAAKESWSRLMSYGILSEDLYDFSNLPDINDCAKGHPDLAALGALLHRDAGGCDECRPAAQDGEDYTDARHGAVDQYND